MTFDPKKLPCPRCNKIEDSYHTYCSKCRNSNPPKPLLEYKTISETYSSTFDFQVNAHLAQGWELHGFPYAGTYSDGDQISWIFNQALIKKGN